jgi:WhiB family redox-sensing transcriptional regulator
MGKYNNQYSSDPGPDKQQHWTAKAKCREHDPEMWFPNASDKLTPQHAIAICMNRCPVRAQCLNMALDGGTRFEHGIFGGLTGEERSGVRRARARERLRAEKTADGGTSDPAQVPIGPTMQLFRRAMTAGMTTAEIATRLNISADTVLKASKGINEHIHRHTAKAAAELLTDEFIVEQRRAYAAAGGARRRREGRPTRAAVLPV